MPLRPEQIQAMRYVRRHGTEAPLDSIRSRVGGTFRDLEELLRSIPADLSARAPAPDKWSVHEIVDHLVVSHRRAVDELASLIAGSSPQDGPIPAGLLSDDPFARTWNALLEDLDTVHRDVLALLDRADEDISLDALAPVVMLVRCETGDGGTEPVEWIERLDWKAYALVVRVHTLEHLRQAHRTLETLDG